MSDKDLKRFAVILVIVCILLLIYTFNINPENLLDERVVKFYKDYIKANPSIVDKAKTRKELDDHVIGEYYKKIHLEDAVFNFIKTDPITIWYNRPYIDWTNLKYLKIWYIDKYTKQEKWQYHGAPYIYTYEDRYFNDPYMRYKKGLKICGVYYFFKLADWEALFDKAFRQNHFQCDVFHINALDQICPSAYGGYAKMSINKLGNIQLGFFELQDFNAVSYTHLTLPTN